MADIREEFLRMLAEVGELSEDEIVEILGGLSKETTGIGVDSEFTAEFKKRLEETREKKKKDAEKICKEITALFANNDWKYSEVAKSEYPLYVLNFKTRRLTVSMRVIVDTNQECIGFDSMLPITCKSQNHVILSYKLTKINASLRYGSFHLDMTDNEISFRYAIKYNAETFVGDLLEIMILVIVRTVDEYYETILSYAQGQINEEEKNEVLKAIQRNVEYLKNNS